MHNWHLGWFCSLYFRNLEPATCKATWDWWNYPAHMHEFSCADCIQESSEIGPIHHCSLCRGRTSSHTGLFINPKTRWLSTVVWGFSCDFFPHFFFLTFSFSVWMSSLCQSYYCILEVLNYFAFTCSSYLESHTGIWFRLSLQLTLDLHLKIDAGIVKILEALMMECTFSIQGGHDLHGEMYD
jgi:hypothetical protein